MPTLHIEHSITDLDTWTTAFNRLAGARRTAGVRSEQVQRPLNQPSYVVIDLGFDTSAEAERFLVFLQTQVWKTPADSPALAGTPTTMILQGIEAGDS